MSSVSPGSPQAIGENGHKSKKTKTKTKQNTANVFIRHMKIIKNIFSLNLISFYSDCPHLWYFLSSYSMMIFIHSLINEPIFALLIISSICICAKSL